MITFRQGRYRNYLIIKKIDFLIVLEFPSAKFRIVGQMYNKLFHPTNTDENLCEFFIFNQKIENPRFFQEGSSSVFLER